MKLRMKLAATIVVGALAASAIAFGSFNVGRATEAARTSAAVNVATSSVKAAAWRDQTGYNLPLANYCNGSSGDGFLALDPHSTSESGYAPNDSKLKLYEATMSCTNGQILNFNRAEALAGLNGRICRPDVDPVGMVFVSDSTSCSSVAKRG